MSSLARPTDGQRQHAEQTSPPPTGQTLLIIDDSRVTQRLLLEILKVQGYTIHCANSGEDGLRLFFETRPDLVLLDIVLPGLDGFEICRRLLALADVPIIFLSTMADEDTIVCGLEAGAVDYVEKPFSAKVLVARVRGALRSYAMPRTAAPLSAQSPTQGESAQSATSQSATSQSAIIAPPEPTPIYDDGYLAINLDYRRVTVAGKVIRLTATEFNLLAYIVENAGQVCTFAQILEHVWGWEEGDKASVYTYIRRIRKKLETDQTAPRYISVMHGVGYRFEKH